MKKYMFKAETIRCGKPESQLFGSQEEAEEFLSHKEETESWDGFDKRIILVEIENDIEKELTVIDSGIGNYEYYIEVYSKHRADQEGYILQSKWFTSKKDAKEWLKSNIDYIDRKNYDIYLMGSKYDKFSDLYGDIEKIEVL
jgi:hypothetical protein